MQSILELVSHWSTVMNDEQIMEIFRARNSGNTEMDFYKVYAFDRILSVALVELQRGIKEDRKRIEKEYGMEFFDCIRYYTPIKYHRTKS